MSFIDDASNLLSNSANLNGVQSALSSIANSLNQYIVMPANAFGLGGLAFDVEGEGRNELNNEITDHYVEDNSTIQDHVGVRPVEITLKGYVGELVFEKNGNSVNLVQTLTQKLMTVGAYLPQLANAAGQAQQIISQGFSSADIGNLSVSDITNTGTDLWSAVENLIPPSTNQQRVYLYLQALANQKTLMSLQTPFAFYNNMVIKNVTAIQNEETKFMSIFSVTLKQVRFATTSTISFNPNDYQPVAYSQNAPVTDNGKLAGSDPSQQDTGDSILAGTGSSSGVAGIENSSNFLYLNQ